MAKRDKIEIIRDILTVIKNNNNKIKSTPLLRQANLSTKRFKKYSNEMLKSEMVKKEKKYFKVTDKGYEFLSKYKTIVKFLDEFEL